MKEIHFRTNVRTTFGLEPTAESSIVAGQKGYDWGRTDGQNEATYIPTLKNVLERDEEIESVQSILKGTNIHHTINFSDDTDNEYIASTFRFISELASVFDYRISLPDEFEKMYGPELPPELKEFVHDEDEEMLEDLFPLPTSGIEK